MKDFVCTDQVSRSVTCFDNPLSQDIEILCVNIKYMCDINEIMHNLILLIDISYRVTKIYLNLLDDRTTSYQRNKQRASQGKEHFAM